MQSIPLVYGVDVAKDELVVAFRDARTVLQVDNTQAAISDWVNQLPVGSLIGMESTGKYHQVLACCAHAAGIRVYVLNARDLFFYAKSLGGRAKTDRVDARVIARYLGEHHGSLHAWQPAGAHSEIDDLLRRRAVVVAKRDGLRQSLRDCAPVREQIKDLDEAFRKLLRVIDQKVQALITADSALTRATQRIASVTGFGPQGSAMLAALLARIPFSSADALVAYSGLDPQANDSGKKRGRRKLSKHGPAFLRRQWYMVGFAASHSKALKPVYLALRSRGFASTEAILILGRKLLRAAYSVWKTGQAFDPAKLMPAAACQQT
jgi:transposase